MTKYVRIASVLVLLLLASPVVILMKGCGDIVNGGACGGCPNTTAPYGSTVTITGGALTDATVPTSGVCYDNVTFTFIGPDKQPLNGICVEIFTNGYIKKSSGSGDCTFDSASYVAGYLRTKTDNGGTIAVDLATGDLSTLCTVPASTQSETFFVHVSSCTADSSTEAILTWTCP